MAIRTDLAIEVLENSGQTTQNAVQTEKNLEGFRLTQVEIHREDERIGKPPGSYYTLTHCCVERKMPFRAPAGQWHIHWDSSRGSSTPAHRFWSSAWATAP